MKYLLVLLFPLFAFAESFFDTTHPHFHISPEISFAAETLQIRASQNLTRDPTFESLSPALQNAITIAFIYLEETNPALLRNGAYYEFGVYKGASIWTAEQVSRGKVSQDFLFYGFDSFEGLPSSSVDTQDPDWFPGQYTCEWNKTVEYLRCSHANFSKIKLIKGWFSEFLFKNFEHQYRPKQPSIVVIDCDVYESCVQVLNYIGPKLVVGSLLLFDDFNTMNRDDNQSERRAFREYLQENPGFHLKHLYSFGWHGEVFEVAKNELKY